jgi:hypothetical protein
MSEFRPSNDAPPLAVARCNGVYDKTLLGMLFLTLIRSGEALAGDQTPIANPAAGPVMIDAHHFSPAPVMAIRDPEFFTVPKGPDAPTFSATDFRPRRHTALDGDPSVSTFSDAPMLRNTTVWQRLSEYRSRDRVRLLTLWESSSSSVSLQAGKRGDPSLQWSSRLMNHDGSTKGLLDRLLSVSFGGSSSSPRSTARPTSAPATSKPAGSQVTAALK